MGKNTSCLLENQSSIPSTFGGTQQSLTQISQYLTFSSGLCGHWHTQVHIPMCVNTCVNACTHTHNFLHVSKMEIYDSIYIPSYIQLFWVIYAF